MEPDCLESNVVLPFTNDKVQNTLHQNMVPSHLRTQQKWGGLSDPLLPSSLKQAMMNPSDLPPKIGHKTSLQRDLLVHREKQCPYPERHRHQEELKQTGLAKFPWFITIDHALLSSNYTSAQLSVKVQFSLFLWVFISGGSNVM